MIDTWIAFGVSFGFCMLTYALGYLRAVRSAYFKGYCDGADDVANNLFVIIEEKNEESEDD